MCRTLNVFTLAVLLRSSPVALRSELGWVLVGIIPVYPQGIIYRAFLFERYGRVLGSPWPLILASAAAFAWVHIVFRNWTALVLSFFAGILFAARYEQTGSA